MVWNALYSADDDMVTIRTIGAIALALLVTASLPVACAPAGREGTPTPVAPANATPDEISAAATLSAISTRPQTGYPAADFTLKGIDGTDITLSSLRGRAVVITFWATWCEHCRAGLPLIADLYEEARDDGLEVLAVNMRDEPEQVVAYAAKLELPFPVLMDRRGEVANRYRVRGLPTTVFVDPEGMVQRVHLGTLDEALLQDYVATLLPK